MSLTSSHFESIFRLSVFRMENDDGSTEEFSDVSQDREELMIRKENEKIEQIQEYKTKLEKLERDELDDLKRVSFANNEINI